ncbi:MAG: exodeoxyribonuclease VII large subunit [Peptococcaceae bacterium]|nr:exodeoxyribonuclease VII large subunit [Peptococcaceae bacterium]
MSEAGIVKVSALNEYIKTIFDSNDHLKRIRVEGEISNFKRHSASGHLYFSLKDASAAISCVMFRSAAERLRQLPQNGDAVIVEGSVSVYTKTGSYQLYAQRMMPVGVGDLQLKYEALKQKLLEEGVFKTEDTRRALPAVPKKIGIVTSPTGAVIRDMIRVLKRRWPMVDVLLVPASVQGAEGVPSICQALHTLYARTDIDVIICGRGGGSLEDLWNFNDEIVVRTIAASPIPIISAVGHETDVTLADFVADVRAGTPSMAAELAVPDVAQVMRTTREARLSLEKQMATLISHKREILKGFLAGGFLQDASKVLGPYSLQLDQNREALEKQIKDILQAKTNDFRKQASRLDAMSPLKVLGRGYSFCEKNGEAVTSVEQVAVGDPLTLTFKDGSVTTEVKDITQKRL